MKVEKGKIKNTLMLVCISISFLCPLPSFHSLQAQYKVEHLGKPLNTAGSETGALRIGDTVLVYASLPPAGNRNSTFDFNNSVTQLYQVRIARNGKLARPRLSRWGLNSKKDHTGNPTIDPWNNDLYFTRGDVETHHCDIWMARALKRGWDKPVRLRGAVNDRQYTATHPAASRLPDSTVLLYFVSDRPGGLGGMDIWYTIVRDGVASEPVNLGPQVNSAADEITPFYDQRNGILYFSSDRQMASATEGSNRHLGGFDIYCAVGSRNTWQRAETVCGCLNSEQNDLYFTITDYEPASGFPIAGYLSSNRKDSYFLNDSMCCNDLYRWYIDSAMLIVLKPEEDTVPPAAPNSELLIPTFPLSLYFHNDDPDPTSRDSTTQADYADCQLRYALMRSTYLAHQSTASDSADMRLFFDSCVVGNFDKVLFLLDHIDNAIDNGKRVVLTVSGHASPLFTDAYNHLLSQRRIGSFINMLRARDDGLLARAIDDGRLRIVQQPMGAEKPNTNHSTPHTKTDPVYSLPAAQARRIVILSCDIY